MKLSEMQKYRELVSAHHRSEISNEEMQKAFIADGAILSNLYQEIEMDSDSVDCHDDVNYTKDSVQLHSHTFYEMLYCCSGNVQYLLGAERYRVHRGGYYFHTARNQPQTTVLRPACRTLFPLCYMDSSGIYEEYPAVFRVYSIIGSGFVKNPGQWMGVPGTVFSICLQGSRNQTGGI